MKEAQPAQRQFETFPELSSFVPAQFRPSSQLTRRTPVLIVNAMCASPPPERRREKLRRLDSSKTDSTAHQ
jgi:hypothetical protein